MRTTKPRTQEAIPHYYALKHTHDKALAAFEHEAQMLYNAVRAALAMREMIKDAAAQKMLSTLGERADAFGAVAYGDAARRTGSE